MVEGGTQAIFAAIDAGDVERVAALLDADPGLVEPKKGTFYFSASGKSRMSPFLQPPAVHHPGVEGAEARSEAGPRRFTTAQPVDWSRFSAAGRSARTESARTPASGPAPRA